ncbi:MAG: hypothetical protein IJT47_00095 [Selenomonadaceae bacterium]|nr:hypothetical protein [Selenomonadaceae bacterium]
MAMEIVHVDPGYGRLMGIPNGYTKLTYVENTAYNPTSDVAFTATQGGRTTFPNLDFTFEPSGQFYKKVWSLKFSVFDPYGIDVGFADNWNGTPDVGVDFSSTKIAIRRYEEKENTDGTITAISKAVQQINNPKGFQNISVTLSITDDGTGKYLLISQIMVDDFINFYVCSVDTLPAFPQYAICIFGITDKDKAFVSNVLVGQASYDSDGTDDIPSDDGIPANTPVYRLPLVAPEEIDFEAGEDGEYIAKANGKKLLQTVDTSTLIERFGNRPLTHVVSYGNPGYRVGTAVTEATGLSKVNESGAQHGTHELSVDKTMHIYDIWKLTQHKDFAALNGVKVGWLSGGAGG